jgi:hypothetical protein
MDNLMGEFIQCYYDRRYNTSKAINFVKIYFGPASMLDRTFCHLIRAHFFPMLAVYHQHVSTRYCNKIYLNSRIHKLDIGFYVVRLTFQYYRRK